MSSTADCALPADKRFPMRKAPPSFTFVPTVPRKFCTHDPTTLVLESIWSNHDTIADRMSTNCSADALRLSPGECGGSGVCVDGRCVRRWVVTFEGLL